MESLPGYDNWKLATPSEYEFDNEYPHDCAPHGEPCPTCQNIEMEMLEAMPEDKSECPHCDQLPCTGLNIRTKTNINHEDTCNKWVPHCDCNKIYVDKWVGTVPECQLMWGGHCYGVKLDNNQKCSCIPDITHYYTMPNGKGFHIYQVWYPCSGSIWKCKCGHEDHTGDTEWDKHICTLRKMIKTSANTWVNENDPTDIPF